jgi:hypothetical protein
VVFGCGIVGRGLQYAGDYKHSRQGALKFADCHHHTIGAALYHAAGAVNAMFEALDAACRQRDCYLLSIQNELFFDRYRSDLRFTDRMNLQPRMFKSALSALSSKSERFFGVARNSNVCALRRSCLT